MSEQLQLRRATAAQVAAFAGAQGEVVADTNYWRLYVNDGSTAGGWATARAQRTAVANAAYTALGTDRIIAYTSLSAAQTVTLPAAANFPVGERLLVVDESGACSATDTITVYANGTDTINGAAHSVAPQINVPFGFLGLESNGSNGWTITDSFLAALGPNGASMQFVVLEFLQSSLSGTSVTCSTQIPANCIVFSVGVRVVTAITCSGSPTGFNIGDQASQGDSGASSTRFGSNVNLAAGSTNYGLVGPFGNYSATNILLTPAGGSSPSFTAGAVRLSIHLAFCNPSAS